MTFCTLDVPVHLHRQIGHPDQLGIAGAWLAGSVIAAIGEAVPITVRSVG